MANLAKWNVGAWVNLFTTGLNSIATGSATAASSAVANGTSKDLFMDVSLILGSINPSGLPYVEIYLLPLLADGTTYADKSAQTLVGTIQVTTGASIKAGMAQGICVPPGDYKMEFVNQTGVTFAGSGNSADYRLYELNLNA